MRGLGFLHRTRHRVLHSARILSMFACVLSISCRMQDVDGNNQGPALHERMHVSFSKDRPVQGAVIDDSARFVAWSPLYPGVIVFEGGAVKTLGDHLSQPIAAALHKSEVRVVDGVSSTITTISLDGVPVRVQRISGLDEVTSVVWHETSWYAIRPVEKDSLELVVSDGISGGSEDGQVVLSNLSRVHWDALGARLTAVDSFLVLSSFSYPTRVSVFERSGELVRTFVVSAQDDSLDVRGEGLRSLGIIGVAGGMALMVTDVTSTKRLVIRLSVEGMPLAVSVVDAPWALLAANGRGSLALAARLTDSLDLVVYDVVSGGRR